MGIRLIARRLNAEDLKTRRGGNWSMVSIRDILRNRVYLGTYQRFGARVPGNHPTLVSAEDFKRVQDRLNARRTSYTPRVTSQFLLSGIAFCGYCGNKLIGVSRKQTWTRRNGEQAANSYRYYQCEGRTNQSVCSYHTRRAAELEDVVRAKVAALLAADAESVAPAAPLAAAAPAADARARERERLLARLRALDRRIARYVEDAVKGRLAKDAMLELGVAAARDRLVLEDAIEALDGDATDGTEWGSGGRLHDAELLTGGWDATPFAERQALLRRRTARVEVVDDAVTVALRA
jgi:site-specific DNA recombinase